MEFFYPKNFHQLSTFNCNLVRFFGYFHFKPSQRHAEKLNLVDILRLFAYLIIGLYISMESSNINMGSLNSLILTVGLDFLLKVTIFMPVVFRTFNFVVRNDLLKIIRNINFIDENLRMLGVQVDHKKHLKVALSVTFGYFSSLLFTLILDDVLFTSYLPEVKMEKLQGLFAVFNLASYLSYNISQMLIILTVQVRVTYLKKLLKLKNLSVTSLKGIRKVHLTLFDTMNSINFCYSLNLISFFFQFTFFVIFFLFDVFYSALTIKSSTLNDLIFAIIQLGYLQFFFWFCAWMIVHSSLLVAEVEEMEDVVQCRSSNLDNPELARNFMFLNLQLQHSKLHVSCGLFEINWKLLFAIIGTVFSYITILFQFELGS